MTIDLKIFIVGLLLLWFPRQWMRRGAAFLRRRRRSAESQRITEPWKDREPGDPRVSFATEFVKSRNYIDLFRAAAGCLMLTGGMGLPGALGTRADAGPTAVYQLITLRALVLVVGVLIQSLRYERNRVTFYPPIFFLAGISIGLCQIQAAVFAFILIWTINLTLPNAQAFLSVYALLMTVFGCFFERGIDRSSLFAGFLCFLPALLSLLAKRPLMIFSRKSAPIRSRRAAT